MLSRVVNRLYQSAQTAESYEEHMLYSVSLRLLGELRKGDSPNPWLTACYGALGSNMAVWAGRNADRKARLTDELNRCVPDYDPLEAARMKKRIDRLP